MASRRALPLVLALAALAACDDRPHTPREPVAAAPVDAPPEYAAHVAALQKKVGARFTIVVEPPFVVLGDEAPARVRQRAVDTVRWATKRLKESFFEKDPARTLDIYLFRDAASYKDHALAFFGETPTTPYGYYSSQHQALIMNIATGEGTLVHEMVHPFIEANLPGCPPWFNEGLASLYERPGEEDGRIYGDTNWRLPALQAAIQRKEVPAWKTLMGLSEGEFYGDAQGVNYAEARYLLYYLQERGLLVDYYKAFAGGRAADPTGEAALQKVLGDKDLERVKAKWEQFVLALHFQ